MRLRGAFVAVVLAVPIVQACGGRSDPADYLFESAGTNSEGATGNVAGDVTGGGGVGVGGSSGRAGSGSAGGGRASTGGRGNGGSTSTGGATTRGGSAGVAGAEMGGAATAGAAGAVSTGGTVSVAGAGGTSPITPITCGDEVCDARTQSCCAGLAGLHCLGGNADCNGATLACTTNADCEGAGICCIAITGNASAASACKPRCDNMGAGRERQLCQTANDCQPPFRFCTATVFGVSICTRRP